MKAILTAFGLMIIIGMDFSIRTFDNLFISEVSFEMAKEASSESESSEKAEKSFNDYLKETHNHLRLINGVRTIEMLSIEFRIPAHNNPWDEIPYPPPEHV